MFEHRPISTFPGNNKKYSGNCTPALENYIKMIRELVLDNYIRYLTTAMINYSKEVRFFTNKIIINNTIICMKNSFLLIELTCATDKCFGDSA